MKDDSQTKWRNADGPVEVVGYGPLSQNFKRIRPSTVGEYLVWATDMCYRMDGTAHPLDVVVVRD